MVMAELLVTSGTDLSLLKVTSSHSSNPLPSISFCGRRSYCLTVSHPGTGCPVGESGCPGYEESSSWHHPAAIKGLCLAVGVPVWTFAFSPADKPLLGYVWEGTAASLAATQSIKQPAGEHVVPWLPAALLCCFCVFWRTARPYMHAQQRACKAAVCS